MFLLVVVRPFCCLEEIGDGVPCTGEISEEEDGMRLVGFLGLARLTATQALKP